MIAVGDEVFESNREAAQTVMEIGDLDSATYKDWVRPPGYDGPDYVEYCDEDYITDDGIYTIRHWILRADWKRYIRSDDPDDLGLEEGDMELLLNGADAVEGDTIYYVMDSPADHRHDRFTGPYTDIEDARAEAERQWNSLTDDERDGTDPDSGIGATRCIEVVRRDVDGDTSTGIVYVNQ